MSRNYERHGTNDMQDARVLRRSLLTVKAITSTLVLALAAPTALAQPTTPPDDQPTTPPDDHPTTPPAAPPGDQPTTPTTPPADQPTTPPADQPQPEPVQPQPQPQPDQPEPQPEPEPDHPELKSGISGVVVDSGTGDPLADVTIEIVGRPDDIAVTDSKGAFRLPLPPDTYTLRVAGDLYTRKRVRGVIVRRGYTTVKIKMSAEAVEEVIVTMPPDTTTEAVQVVRRRKRAVVSDAISAEQIQRSPDSNAGDAAKRMVAATIEDGRYVVIRGLGGRYSLTLLNGVILPSPDPDVPAAPLDLFPAALVANLTVSKTFSPDMPGNFAGGALSIETRSFPTKFTLKTKLGVSADSQTSFRSLNAYDGGSLDVLGYDDGTRAMPSAIPGDRLAGDPSLSQAELNEQAGSFNNTWEVEPSVARPNFSLGVTVGDTLELPHKQRLGYFAAANYGHSSLRRRIHIARVGESDGMGGYLPSVLQLDEDQGTRSSTIGGLGTAGWAKGANHQVNLVMLYAHSGDVMGSDVTGVDNSTAQVDRLRLRFLQREMIFGQLVGEHTLGGGRAIVNWQANLARVGQNEPDTRDLLRAYTPAGDLVINDGSGSAERLFATLEDLTGGGGLDLTVPLRSIKLKVGGSVLASDRTYQARRFHFDLSGDSVFLPPDQAFDPSNAGSSMSMYETTTPTDGYVATRTIAAGYALADIEPIDDLRVLGGVRYEHSALDVGLDSKIDLMSPPMDHTKHSDGDFLPAVNTVYALNKTTNLRAAYALTVARANFREIAPALYFDYVRRRAIGGNPDLEETKIHNVDFRYETFLSETELVAASAFYKHFVKPIEKTLADAGDGQNVGFQNAKAADTYGIELEAKLSMGRLTPKLGMFTVGGNLSLIRSKIDLEGVSRPLQGQSPYVLNLGLGYESEAAGTQVDVLYNAFGARIDEVGTGGAGNVYEQPVHRLDVTFSKKLPNRLKLKLAGTNLLGARVVRLQNGVEILAYPQGVTVAGSLEMSID